MQQELPHGTKATRPMPRFGVYRQPESDKVDRRERQRPKVETRADHGLKMRVEHNIGFVQGCRPCANVEGLGVNGEVDLDRFVLVESGPTKHGH